MSAQAQTLNKVIEDSDLGRNILLNACTRDSLVDFPEMKEHFNRFYEEYEADSITIQKIKPLMNDARVTIVLGTWCGDSKLQVPRFLRVADMLSVPKENITFIGVNRKKQAEEDLLKDLNIQRVPTFIIYDKSGKEIGRLVERPQETLEDDLLTILKGQ